MPIISLPDVLAWEATQQPALTPTLRKSFDCGEASLNIFLSNHARQADEENTARTWVNLDQNQKKILGYISLSNTSIEKDAAAGSMKVYTNPIPALLIGRLAVDQSAKGQGLGEALLLFGLQKAKEVNASSAIQAIVVDTLNASAEAFYRRYGFVKIGSTGKMIISTKGLF